MKTDRRRFIASSLLTVGAASVTASAREISRSGEARDVSLRGRIICLTEELQRLYQVLPDCDHRGHVYTLKTGDGKLYPLLPTDPAAAVWMDQRYRVRDLQVTARTFPEGPYLEIIKYQSWRFGKLHDLYYFCDVCMISTHKPGPCECCQEPVQFRETPADENGQD